MDYTFLNLNGPNFGQDQITAQYFDMLYLKVAGLSPTQRVEGTNAVGFLQLSGLDLNMLSQIWNLSSVFK